MTIIYRPGRLVAAVWQFPSKQAAEEYIRERMQVWPEFYGSVHAVEVK